MNCKPNDLAIVVRRGDNPLSPDCRGMILKVARQSPEYFGCWETEPKVFAADGAWVIFPDDCLRPIRDQPGNEHWITELRNKLKGKTEITERGEVRV